MQRHGKGRTQNSFFIGYLKISCFYHVICENDSVRPETEGHPSAAGKGGVSSGGQLGFESQAFH